MGLGRERGGGGEKQAARKRRGLCGTLTRRVWRKDGDVKPTCGQITLTVTCVIDRHHHHTHPHPHQKKKKKKKKTDIDDLIDVVVQTAVDASMSFARRLFASAPLVTAPVAPYVATLPQCQCFDRPPPPPLPFQQQATPRPPPPSAPSQQQQPPPPTGLPQQRLRSFSPYRERA